MKKILFFLFGILLFTNQIQAQTSISSTINSYIDVTAIIDTDELTVSNASAFSPGDTVLLIQMKGFAINNTNDANFGSRQNVYSAGKYEIIIIASISGNNITLASDMTNSYDVNGHMQMVRVPGYDNAIVTGNLTCPVWDTVSGTGGVVALIVGNKLSLEADIDVTGKGFAGAEPYTTSDVLCTTNTDYYFPAGSDSAGYKGEGIASYALDNTNPLNGIYAKGRGAYFNGGGGGNGKYSGGGGGANGGSGGLGGKQAEICAIGSGIGGIGGRAIPNEINSFDTEKLIFMGGGGGASTQLNDGDGTTGGNGGGIIIILADTIIGNGHYIKANGQTVVDITNDTGGAGGGGAGGTILLDVKGYKGSTLNVQALGGNGGWTGAAPGSCTGPGGGGGGGIVWYSQAVLPAEITLGVDGGSAGSESGNCVLWSQSPGNIGTTVADLKVPLTGFLFNSIFSIQSEALNDTICEEDILPKLLGTSPRGGTPAYEYRWESSNDNSTWNIDLDYGAGGEDYDPLTVMIDTTYYRRTVKDNSTPMIVDISKTVTIIVQPKLEQNSLNFGLTNTSSIDGNDGSINLIVSGCNGPYFYSWSNSETTEDISGLSAGVYFVTVTDVRDSTATDSIRVYDTFIDNRDSQVYKAITIGNQTWMAENLKTTHYANGIAIPLVENNSAWDALGYTDKAYCYYDNSTSNRDIYGALYTWPGAMNGETSSDNNPSGVQGVCPDNWHMPSDSEWKELEMYLGMSQAEADGTDIWRGTDEGGKLKETDTTHWNSPNTGATNESGFSALPGGYRGYNGTFYYIGSDGHWWSAAENDATHAWFRRLGYNYSEVGRYDGNNSLGFSVRCVKNSTLPEVIVSHAGLTEANLNGALLEIKLINETFTDGTLDKANFSMNNAPSGTSIDAVNYINTDTATVTLAFDGTDFDIDSANFNITVSGVELTGANDLTGNSLVITALVEPLVILLEENNITSIGGTDGSIDLTVSEGLSPYTYS